jgi:predicted outer membrane repeat protein
VNIHNKRLSLNILGVIIIAALLTACGNNTPAQTTTYTPGCSTQNLIGHIKQANSDPGPAIINLDANCTYTLTEVDNTEILAGVDIYSGLPVISSMITINGNNAIIDIDPGEGEHFFGHFYIDVELPPEGEKQDLEKYGDLELYDLTLLNGNRYAGGAVVNNGGDFYASQVTFQDNLAYPADGNSVGKGGAIYSDSGRVRVVDDCRFESNMAGWTMATGANLGGAIYARDTALVVSNTYFFQNHASGDGGAIYSEKTPTNTAGGVIRINDSNFTENTAQQNGGGLALVNEIEGVFIATSYFRGQNAENFGGAVYAEGSEVYGDHLEFRSNFADFGGAVFTRRVTDGSVSSYHDEDSLYIVNTATVVGGAIFSENSDLTLDVTEFSENHAGSCGAIRLGDNVGLDVTDSVPGNPLVIHSASEISSSSITTNEALNGYGGGICHLKGELVIDETIFSENQASSYGGGLISMARLDVNSSEFNNNQAGRGGGLVVGYPLQDNNYVSPTFLTDHASIDHCNVSNNEALDAGGGIWIHYGGTVLINKSTLAYNTASAEGGGVYLEEGDLIIENSTIAHNSGWRGGGLYNEGNNSELELTHTTVAYNSATDGGSELRSGGGGLNINGIVRVNEALVVLNTNKDCDLNQGLEGDYADCPNHYCAYAIDGTDSDDTCGFPFTDPVPLIGSFNGLYIPILAGSPLINRTDTHCYTSDDQLGTSRPQSALCEAGSVEYTISSSTPPPPPPPPPDDSSSDCDPFADTEYSLVMLNVAAGSTDLTLYLKVEGGIPSALLPAIQAGKIVTATLGNTEANLCNLQGFEDRIYCMFTLPPNTLGTVQDLRLIKDDCEDPLLILPSVSIPTPKLVCKESLGEAACVAAGGHMGSGVTTAPKCVCP